jgi:hypothetical protein
MKLSLMVSGLVVCWLGFISLNAMKTVKQKTPMAEIGLGSEVALKAAADSQVVQQFATSFSRHAKLIADIYLQSEDQKKSLNLSKLLDQEVQKGDSAGVFYLLVGGADPEAHLGDHCKVYSILDAAIYHLTSKYCNTLASQQYDPSSGADLAEGIGIICMLLAAGATRKNLQEDCLEQSVRCAIELLVSDWSTSAQRHQLIKNIFSAMGIQEPQDSKYHDGIDDILAVCEIITKIHKQSAVRQRNALYQYLEQESKDLIMLAEAAGQME